MGGILFFDQRHLGLDREGISVDVLSPGVVANVREMSVFTLEEIEVEVPRTPDPTS